MTDSEKLDILITGMADMRSDMADMRSDIVDMRSDIAEVNSDISDIKADLKAVKRKQMRDTAELKAVDEMILDEFCRVHEILLKKYDELDAKIS